MAQYAGGAAWAFFGHKLLPRRIKASHVTAFRVGAGMAVGAKVLYTEVIPRLPNFPGKEALGATYGYDASGQGWALRGNNWVAMQGLGTVVHGNAYDMGEVVQGNAYDGIRYREQPANVMMEESVAGF